MATNLLILVPFSRVTNATVDSKRNTEDPTLLYHFGQLLKAVAFLYHYKKEAGSSSFVPHAKNKIGFSAKGYPFFLSLRLLRPVVVHSPGLLWANNKHAAM